MNKIVIALSVMATAFSLNAQTIKVHLADGSTASFPAKEVKEVTFEEENEASHVAIDLGLSVKWATTNIGAENPEEYGDYFAWGETETKEYFGTDNSSTLFEDIIWDITLHDAAYALWGADWRLPTPDEIRELIDKNNCDWEWANVNGINGMKVTSKVPGFEGNHIFLPAAGFITDDLVLTVGDTGLYWSSGPGITPEHTDAFQLGFMDGTVVCGDADIRSSGFSIRPVCE